MFQFALPRGERLMDVGQIAVTPKFQFALPRGERRSIMASPDGLMPVSIRAPARGATSAVLRACLARRVSIRAPARGATDGQQRRGQIHHRFQFALPRGERRWQRSAITTTVRVSIRAPARGATKQSHPIRQGQPVSIRAPARGATYHIPGVTGLSEFQFALPRGERRSCCSRRAI